LTLVVGQRHLVKRNKTKFYTGLKTLNILISVFELSQPGIDSISSYNTNKRKLTFEEQLLLTLMRLRLNMTMQDLAYGFDMSVSSTTRYFNKWVCTFSKSTYVMTIMGRVIVVNASFMGDSLGNLCVS
jgi:hypothetical protein